MQPLKKNYKRYTVTSALPYANGPLHIGHIAGAYLPADIYVRYLRMKKKDVAFICGSDEHGAAITLRARKEGKSPQEIIDLYHEMNKSDFKKFGISFDIYHRTSSELHHETASDFFKTLHDKGKLTQQESEQFYDEEHKIFLADRYVTGTCPRCSSENAYGDQCEKCGASLNPTDLINPKSVLSGSKPVLRRTSHWYLPLNQYETWLKEWIVEGHKSDWKPNVYGQCKSWIDGGLQPRAMTRDLDWGVKVPLADSEGKVLYVWLDAPIGYISATKQWASDNGKNWEDYWKSEDTRLLHFIGKDNIVFHCIIFPVILKAHGEYIMPDNVPANEFLNLEGQKFSTSRNWAVWLKDFLEDFPCAQDELRYVLCSIAPESKDSEFTWKDYQARVNNELVAILGNFVNRVMVLTHKYFEGEVPYSVYEPEDEEIHQKIKEQVILADKLINQIGQHIEKFNFREALFTLIELARSGNQFLQVCEPWKKYKAGDKNSRENREVATVLNYCLNLTAKIGVAAQPFLPFASRRIFKMLNLSENDIINAIEPVDNEEISLCIKEHFFNPGNKVGTAEILFPKIEDAAIQIQIDKLKQPVVEVIEEPVVVEYPAQKEEVAYDDFTKMDIRTATILQAEKVKGADKLLKLQVDTGIDIRTVVSGIAEHFDPEKIVGKKVSILANLAPRKIRGIESKGMILLAENGNGKLIFVSPDSDAENGSVIK